MLVGLLCCILAQVSEFEPCVHGSMEQSRAGSAVRSQGSYKKARYEPAPGALLGCVLPQRSHSATTLGEHYLHSGARATAGS